MKVGDNMARPSKSVSVISKNLTSEERKARENTEKLLKGSSNNIKPFRHLNKRQKQIFKYIVDNLEESKILGNLDIYILNQTAISIERLETMDKEANDKPELLYQASFKGVHDMYSKDFFRCCNELCLSPQSRAKLSISAIPKEKDKKTLSELLSDEDDE